MTVITYNDRAARGAQPAGGKRTRFSVADRPGLVLDVQPGDPPSRRWYVRYQVGKGANRRQGYDLIGDLAHWSIAQAWEFASKVIRDARSGVDPAAKRVAAEVAGRQATRTVADLFHAWLANPRRKRTLSLRTRTEKQRVYERHMAPVIGKVPLVDLDADTIRDLLEDIRKATTDEARGFRGAQSLIARQIIHAMCVYALDEGYIERNPCRAVAKPVPQENPRGRQHRALTDDELRRVWSAAPEHVPPMYVRLFRLALLTGRRRTELAYVKTNEVDLSREPILSIPADREGNKARVLQLVPLCPTAVTIFREQIDAAGGSPFVFQPRALRHKPVDKHETSRRWKQLRENVGITAAVRLHDVRTLLNNHLNRLGVPSEIRSHVLSHTGDMHRTLADRVYNEYDFLPEKRRALELWECRLLAIVEGREIPSVRW